MELRVWLQGKKTIFGGAFLIAIAVVGAFYGKLSPIDAMTVGGVGMSICGMGAKSNRLLAALTQVAQAGVDLRLGNKAGALADLKPVAQELATEAKPWCAIPNCPDCAAMAAAEAALPLAPQLIPAALKPAPPLPSGPALSGDDAMRPGPARTATAEEWAHLQQVASTAGEAKS